MTAASTLTGQPSKAASVRPAKPPIPYLHLGAVLAGLPAISSAISLLLLERGVFAVLGLDFFTAFWLLITGWYALQIALLGRVLRVSGWTWGDIGLHGDRRRAMRWTVGYLVVAFAVMGLVEGALAQAELTPDRLRALSDLADLTPQTTAQRVVFIFMGLFAGLAEELVYRGFAITALRQRGLHAVFAVPLAAIPFVLQHGLKSVEQFGWFFGWGLAFGALFVITRRLLPGLVLHWMVILAALPAILQALR